MCATSRAFLRDIQEDWRNKPKGTISLNRLTAWNLSRCLRRRLDRRVSGTTKSHRSVDVVVTGCEVSLWLAEQFAADLANAFPRLDVRSVSANKILGLFGQDLPVPSIGHPRGKRNDDFTDSIVIVVSHSGGTFAPLASSNLLVSSTSAIFVVASEWDTQIGKQLRAVKGDGAFTSRIFSTDVGVRPAEPCSVSVAATQQLLAQIFMHVSLVILGNKAYASVTRARRSPSTTWLSSSGATASPSPRSRISSARAPRTAHVSSRRRRSNCERRGTCGQTTCWKA